MDKVIDIANTIITLKVDMPHNRQVYTMILTPQQKAILPLFGHDKA